MVDEGIQVCFAPYLLPFGCLACDPKSFRSTGRGSHEPNGRSVTANIEISCDLARIDYDVAERLKENLGQVSHYVSIKGQPDSGKVALVTSEAAET